MTQIVIAIYRNVNWIQLRHVLQQCARKPQLLLLQMLLVHHIEEGASLMELVALSIRLLAQILKELKLSAMDLQEMEYLAQTLPLQVLLMLASTKPVL